MSSAKERKLNSTDKAILSMCDIKICDYRSGRIEFEKTLEEIESHIRPGVGLIGTKDEEENFYKGKYSQEKD
ncbi:hypothetical protein ACJQWK_01469 [Exserohilum turcicum]